MADGKVTIKAVLDHSDIIKGVQSINSDLSEIGTQIGVTREEAEKSQETVNSTLVSTGNSLVSVGNVLKTQVTQPLIGVGAESINLAVVFEQTMAVLQAQTGLSADAMDVLREKAIQVGQDTVFSNNEAAAAMLELAKAGMNQDQILGGVLDSTMKLATVGDMALVDSSTAVVNAMNQFGLSASDTDAIVVALAGAANASVADVSDLAAGLGNVGTVANQVGWDLNATSGALALLTDNGIAGAEAGTALKSMLMHVINPSKAAAETMEAYGIELYDSEGKMKSLTEISQILGDKLGNLSDQERNAALSSIFGAYGIQAANVMYAAGEEKIQSYVDATYDNAAAQGMMDAKMSGLAGAMEAMSGSIETAKTALGTALAPTIETVAGIISDLMDRFSSLPEPIQSVIASIGLVVAAVGPVLIGVGAVLTLMGSIGPAIGSVIGSIGNLGNVFVGLASGPVGIVIAAITAVTGIMAYLYNTNEEFAKQTDSVIGGIISLLQSAWASIQQIVAGVMGILQGMWSVIEPIFNAIVTFIGTVIISVVGNLITFLTGTVIPTVEEAVSFIQSILEPLCAFFETYILPIISGVLEGVANAFTTLSGSIAAVMGNIREIIEGVWNAIKGVIEIVVGWIVFAVTQDFSMISSGISDIMNGISSFIKGAWNGILNTISGILNSILDIVSGIFEGIVHTIGNAIGNAKSTVSEGLSHISNFFSSLKLQLPHIALPHFSISGTFSLNPPSIPTIGISWYAKGGIFNGPTLAGIGEAGPEAVLPLNHNSFREIASGIAAEFDKENSGATVINIAELVVREEADIYRIARELETLRQRKAWC